MAAPMIWAALAGAGLGAAKHYMSDVPAAERQRKLAAATARYSPWTGLTPQMPQDPSLFNSVLQGGMAGGMFGQQFGGAAAPAAAAAPVAAPMTAASPAAQNQSLMSGQPGSMQQRFPWLEVAQAQSGQPSQPQAMSHMDYRRRISAY